LTAHYRTQMSFSWESLEANATALNRLYKAAYDWGEPGNVIESVRDAFLAEVNEDLNFPKALALVWDMVRSDAVPADKKATLLELDLLLGLDIAAWAPKEALIPEAVLALVESREVARKAKDFREADRLRDEIKEIGFVIEDTREGPKISHA
ncbi:MAG: hypothetical protein VW714_11675, partial [Rhodospirillales bacterium]